MTAPEPPHDLEAALRRHFGFGAFRVHQRAIIESVLAGRPTLAVMPTGAGKSLCYQLPAMLLRGVTLVVSPLIALMKDQVDALQARGLAATFVNSTLGERERLERTAAMARGDYRLVYLAPERFRSAMFLDALRRTPVALLAVDEAHCISQWGHDFRPDYARLGEVRAALGWPRTLALTASATPYVRGDICRALRMADAAQFIAGFDRPNLHLRVQRVGSIREKAERAAGLAERAGSGIVYAATRRSAQRFAGELAARGVPAICYHAGMSDTDRRAAQEAFMRRPRAVVVATSAFGMGVDKPDIRFVVHAELPRSLEAYYQEIGRAGRDGAPALALMLFNHADFHLQKRIVFAAHPDEMLLRDLWQLLRQRPYVELPVAAIAAALGAHAPQVHAAMRLLEQAGHLEHAGEEVVSIALRETRGDLPLQPRLPDQRALLEALPRLVGPAGRAHLGLDRLAREAGVELQALRRALDGLERVGALSLKLPGGRALKVVDGESGSENLRVDIGQLRWRLAREMALLRRVSGFAYTHECRRRFLLRYFGEESPARCGACDNCAAAAAEPDARVRALQGRVPRTATLASTWERHVRGESPEAIARARGLPVNTVLAHLTQLRSEGWPVAVERAIDAERLAQIREAARQRGSDPACVRRGLPPDFTLEEVRLALCASGSAAAAVEQQSPEAHQHDADDERLHRDEDERHRGEQQPVPERGDAAVGDGGEVRLHVAEPADEQHRQPVEERLQEAAVGPAEPAGDFGAEPEDQVRDADGPGLVKDGSP